MPEYYHVSPAANVDSIQQFGLLVNKSQGRLRGVWLVTETRVPWAINHTKKRHGCDTVLVLRVHIPRRWRLSSQQIKTNMRGVWLVRRDIPHGLVLSCTETRYGVYWSSWWYNER